MELWQLVVLGVLLVGCVLAACGRLPEVVVYLITGEEKGEGEE